MVRDSSPASLNRLRENLSYLVCSIYKALRAEAQAREVTASLLVKLWVTITDWQVSKDFLQNYTELFAQDARKAFAAQGGKPIPINIAVHQAILTLAGNPGGIENAYRCIVDHRELEAQATIALEAQDPDRLYAAAILQTCIHGQALLGAVRQVLAGLLTQPESELSPSVAAQLAGLAAEATVAERHQVATQLDLLSTNLRDSIPGLLQLRRVLVLVD